MNNFKSSLTKNLTELSKVWKVPENITVEIPEPGKSLILRFPGEIFDNGQGLVHLLSRTLEVYGVPLEETSISSFREGESNSGTVMLRYGEGENREVLISKGINYFFELIPQYVETRNGKST